jgi:hypothetical protein
MVRPKSHRAKPTLAYPDKQEVSMRFRNGFSLFIVALFLSIQCQAQTLGSITGEVRDAAGAAIANANITVTDVATSAVREVRTNVDGIFLVPSLIPDIYTVKVEATGFRTSIRSNIEL